MNKQYMQQAQRLQEIWEQSSAEQGSRSGAAAATATATPIAHVESGGSGSSSGTVVDTPASSIHGDGRASRDPLIYPGVYAPSGFDLLGILIRVRTRPNPRIDIGNIDSSVALVVCDAEAPDTPIIYCSEHFETLTGYTSAEILGHNCRFLQYPPHDQEAVSLRPSQIEEIRKKNEIAKSVLKRSEEEGDEAQVELVNFRRDGRMFVNVLTTIPVVWEEEDTQKRNRRLIVGFQVDKQRGLYG